MNMEALTSCARGRTNRGVESMAIGKDLTASRAPRRGAEELPKQLMFRS